MPGGRSFPRFRRIATPEVARVQGRALWQSTRRERPRHPLQSPAQRRDRRRRRPCRGHRGDRWALRHQRGVSRCAHTGLDACASPVAVGPRCAQWPGSRPKPRNGKTDPSARAPWLRACHAPSTASVPGWGATRTGRRTPPISSRRSRTGCRRREKGRNHRTPTPPPMPSSAGCPACPAIRAWRSVSTGTTPSD